MTQVDLVVVGIDVGGTTKGFHAVALRGGAYLDQKTSTDPAVLLRFCRDLGAVAIGIDAPCRFRAGERARSAERALAQEGIHCFSTPSAATASHPFFGWIHNGQRLYRAIEDEGYPLYDGTFPARLPVVFETFPHAIERVFDPNARAADKRKARPKLVQDRNIATETLRGIDFIDAALCALAAHHLSIGQFRYYGDDPAEGLIVVPTLFGPPASSG